MAFFCIVCKQYKPESKISKSGIRGLCVDCGQKKIVIKVGRKRGGY